MHVGQTPGAATDVAMLVGRIAKDKGVWGDIARHDGAGPDQRESADGHAAHDDGTRADGRAIFDQRGRDLPFVGAFQLAIGCDGAWKHVVGEADVGANKYAIFQRETFKEGSVILYLHIRADMHVRIDVDAFANVATLTYMRVFSHMCLSPDARTRTDDGIGRNFCGWMGENWLYLCHRCPLIPCTTFVDFY